MPLGIVSDKDFETELNKFGSISEIRPPTFNKFPSQNNSNSVPDCIPFIEDVEVINEITGEFVEISNKGRQVGSREVPNSLRKMIGEESQINGRDSALKLAQQFGISKSSVSAYANGSTSTASYDEPKSDIRQHINRSRERISKKAQSKLIAALNYITPETLGQVDKLKDISSIAKDMSSIVKDMEPPLDKNPQVNGPQFIFYCPQIKTEEHFETILLPNNEL